MVISSDSSTAVCMAARYAPLPAEAPSFSKGAG
jgi:hypothetical protein